MIIQSPDLSQLQGLTELAQRTYTQAFGHSFSPQDLQAHVARHLSQTRIAQMMVEDQWLIAIQAGSMLGFIQIGDAIGVAGAAKEDLELRRLYVSAQHQTKRIGSKLMEAALDLEVLRAAPRIWLDVWEANLGAIRFYQRFGFRIVDTRTFNVASGAETDLDLIMVRRSSQ
jgi:ribosomal protein S18 acetylase RimI-like enzyme